jgi:hypothetical protein
LVARILWPSFGNNCNENYKTGGHVLMHLLLKVFASENVKIKYYNVGDILQKKKTTVYFTTVNLIGGHRLYCLHVMPFIRKD